MQIYSKGIIAKISSNTPYPLSSILLLLQSYNARIVGRDVEGATNPYNIFVKKFSRVVTKKFIKMSERATSETVTIQLDYTLFPLLPWTLHFRGRLVKEYNEKEQLHRSKCSERNATTITTSFTTIL